MANIVGTSGDDILVQNAGQDDDIDGGGGSDTLDLSGMTEAARLFLALSAGQVIGPGQGTDTIRNVENAIGTAFDDLIVGANGGSVLYGGDGQDQLQGRGGDDDLNGYIGDDLLIGNAGNDVLFGSSGKDVLRGGLGNNTLDGSSGFDRADYSRMGEGVDVSLAGGWAVPMSGNGSFSDTLTSIEEINASAFGDRVVGDAGVNKLFGLAGNDVLFGDLGNDTLSGGAGDDVVIGGGDRDYVLGGAGDDLILTGLGRSTAVGEEGIDTISYETFDRPGGMFINIESRRAFYQDGSGLVNDRLYEFENIIATDTDDKLIGNAANNLLEGRGGNDYLDGKEGDDDLQGGDGDDTIIGRIGSDMLQGGAGDDYLRGDEGDDVLFGGAGLDTLVGAAGDDIIHIAGAGFAGIYGGDGVDTLVLDGTAVTLDISVLPEDAVSDVEYFDLGGRGNSLALNQANVAALGGQVYVQGDVSDSVSFADGGWAQAGAVQVDGVQYDIYQRGASEVRVQWGVNVEVPPVQIAWLDIDWNVDGSTGGEFNYTSGTDDSLGYLASGLDPRFHSEVTGTTTPMNGFGEVGFTVNLVEEVDLIFKYVPEPFFPFFDLMPPQGDWLAASLAVSAVPTDPLLLDGQLYEMSADGSVVLAGGNGGYIWLHDLRADTQTIVSKAAGGMLAQATSGSLSADGNLTAFVSAADFLDANDTDTVADVFLYNRLTDQTTMISTDSAGAEIASPFEGVLLSADGNKAAMWNTDGYFVKDLNTGVLSQIADRSNELIISKDLSRFIYLNEFTTPTQYPSAAFTSQIIEIDAVTLAHSVLYEETEAPTWDFADVWLRFSDLTLSPDGAQIGFAKVRHYSDDNDDEDYYSSLIFDISSSSVTQIGSTVRIERLYNDYLAAEFGIAFDNQGGFVHRPFEIGDYQNLVTQGEFLYGEQSFLLNDDGSVLVVQRDNRIEVRGFAPDPYIGDQSRPNLFKAQEFAAHMVGGPFNDLLIGNSHPDILEGHGGNDVLIGNGGNDRFEPGLHDGETDTIKGGDGADRIVAEGYVSSTDPTQGVDIHISSPGAGTIYDLATGTHLLASFESIEALFGTDNVDRMVNNSATGLSMFGNDGDDALTGGSGVDLANGGAGDDVLDAGGGNDRSVGGTGQDRFVLGDGVDRLLDFTRGDDVFDITALGFTSFAQVQAQLSASAGGAIFSHAGGTTQFIGIDVSDLTQDDFYFFRVGDDTLIGTPNAETLDGFHGDDIIFGEGGADILLGSAGDDTIHVPDLAFAQIDGGAGANDKLVLQGAGQVLDLPAIDDALLRGIERFDLTGSGANQINVDESEIANLGGLIKVNGAGADTLFFSHGPWSLQGTTQQAGILYDVYAQNGQTIWAQQGMMVDNPPPVLNVVDWVWDTDGSGQVDVHYTSSSNQELVFDIDNANGRGGSGHQSSTPVNGNGVLSFTVDGPQRPRSADHEFDPQFGLTIEYDGMPLQQAFNTGVATTKVELDGQATSVSDDGALVTANYLTRVYLYDLENQTSMVVSKANDGFVYSGSDGYITPSGSHVAYNSNDNLVPHDTGTTRDVFVYNMALDQTVRASEHADGTALSSTSTLLAMSDDGNQVWFRSTGGIYRKTLDTGQLDLMTSANLVAAPDGSNFGYLQNSQSSVQNGDDETVTYITTIYLVDLQTGVETAAYAQSETWTLGQFDSASISGSDLVLSRDGNFASFEGRSYIETSFHQDVLRHFVVDLGAGTIDASSSGSQSAQRGDYIVTDGGVAYDGQGGFVYRPIESFVARPQFTESNFLYGTGGPFYVDGDASSLFVNSHGTVRVRGDVQREIFQGVIDQPNFLKADISAADMRGGNENDLLLGSPQNDLLAGSGGNDVLYGHEGDDVIDGGAGDDHINAGAGADLILLSDGLDKLVDFIVGEDRLDVSHAGYADFAAVQANLSDAAGGAILSHAGGTTQLTGIGVAMLDASDFVYA